MNLPFRADLHCPSTCSDGSNTPSELLQLAAEIGITGLSITDHDTIDAYTPNLLLEAQKHSLRLLQGIEISSEFENVSVHVLGYGFDLESASLKSFLSSIQKRRKERNLAILEKLSQKKMPISEQELTSFAHTRSIGRPHIAALMVQKKYVSSIPEAFTLYLKDGGSCYISGMKYPSQEVIEQIHKAGGKAVLAHPHFYPQGRWIKHLLTLPFDGIECYYAKLPKHMEEPWLKIAKEKNWIPTGGSDYHGTIKPESQLGSSWVSEEIFNALSQSKSKRETSLD